MPSTFNLKAMCQLCQKLIGFCFIESVTNLGRTVHVVSICLTFFYIFCNVSLKNVFIIIIIIICGFVGFVLLCTHVHVNAKTCYYVEVLSLFCPLKLC